MGKLVPADPEQLKKGDKIFSQYGGMSTYLGQKRNKLYYIETALGSEMAYDGNLFRRLFTMKPKGGSNGN